MTLLLAIVASAAATALALPVLILVLECVAGLLPRRRVLAVPSGPRPPAAVIVPAHDEEAGLGSTLIALSRELQGDDRLIVVCDNCADNTAEVALQAGAEVFERHDPSRRGKGYAISFALDALSDDPPAVVVIIDADCTVARMSIDRLVRAALDTGRPVQGEYLLELPEHATMRARVSAFAVRVRNRVRLRGLSRVFGTTPLVGSGMAFPWDVLVRAEAMRDNLVEDLALGIDCALRGRPPVFCPEAQIKSVLPVTDRAALTQRRRWETGQLAMLRRWAFHLVKTGVKRRDRALVGLGLDLSVPPLSLLVLLLAAGGVLAVGAALAGVWIPALLLGAELSLAAAALGVTWVVVGRSVLPLRAAAAIPVYLLWKLPLYLGFFTTGAEKRWVRTERGSS